MTEAERQRQHRQRIKDRLACLDKRTAALEAVLAELEGNDKPLANKLRQIVTEALA